MNITGAGSSFVYPLMARWATAYKAQTGQAINYQSIGSGGGLQQLRHTTVDFAAVDMPQTSQTLNSQHWIQFPLAMGGLSVTINVPGIENNQLRLTGPVLAKIFLGEITHWNNPAIAKLNPQLKLPNLSITVVHRADGSGTTFNFTHYLNDVSQQWKKKVGASTEVDWPCGIGGKGNSGVAMFVERVPGSIGYVEYSFAKLTDQNTIQLKNRAGNFVKPTAETFLSAAKHAHWEKAKNYRLLLINQPGKNSWPIMATTFALLPISKDKTARDKSIMTFVRWGYNKGGVFAKQLDYVPLPKSTVISIEHYWQKALATKADQA